VITAKKLVRFANYYLFRLTNRILDPIEKAIAPGREHFAFAPTFIIGAPRSGSTLLYQTLVNAFDFGYLTNLHCRFYGGVYLVQALLGNWLSLPQSPYSSKHGKVYGWSSPSECGQFWYRWFRHDPQYVPIEEVDMQQLQSLRRVLIALTDAFGKPLLFKNLYCALRLQPLAVLFPEARFIFIRRHPLWTAQSLLLVRQRVYGDKSSWWSMEPPDIDEIRDLAPEEQVLHQVNSIHQMILEEERRIGQDRFLHVSFEGFCQDVYGELERVKLFLEGAGIQLTARFRVPQRFPISHQVQLPQNEFSRLKTLVEGIYRYDQNI